MRSLRRRRQGCQCGAGCSRVRRQQLRHDGNARARAERGAGWRAERSRMRIRTRHAAHALAGRWCAADSAETPTLPSVSALPERDDS